MTEKIKLEVDDRKDKAFQEYEYVIAKYIIAK